MELIFEGQTHVVDLSWNDDNINVDAEVWLDANPTKLKLKECLGHPNPLFRTIFALYLKEYREANAFKFCCVPELKKVGEIWQ